MKKILQIPKIQKFQESLAVILKVNMVILDADGRLLAGYNRQSPPFSLFQGNPGLEEEYGKFFAGLPSLDWGTGDHRAL